MTTSTKDVAFFVFNRPQETRLVFDAIRDAKPARLFLIADGSRSHPTEKLLCAEVRDIVSHINWPCQVMKNFSDVNMGCGPRVASGLDWTFKYTENAIILEDDCLPDPSFFPFCSALLDHYRDADRVMMISGNNFQKGRQRGRSSYYFSAEPHCWGWATWRRAWQRYDFFMPGWAERRGADWLKQFARSPVMRSYWSQCFDKTMIGEIDTWDYQWRYAIWANSGLCVVPQVNLVTNVGFNNRATHTKRPNKVLSVPSRPIDFPLRHPLMIVGDPKADAFERRRIYRLGLGASLQPTINRLRPRFENTVPWKILRWAARIILRVPRLRVLE